MGEPNQYKIKKKPLSECPDEDLEWGASSARNAGLRQACANELARRGRKVPDAQPAPQSRAITKPQDRLAVGATHDPIEVTKRLQEISEKYHLVSPATSCENIPPGCGVTVTLVHVDPSTEKSGPGEVYALSGKVGLSGTSLKRIGAAAGVSWNVRECGRLDNGSDPHYVQYRAVGTVKNFDGTPRQISGEVEIDLREGSPQVDEIRQKADQRAEGKNYQSDGGAKQLLEYRKFILRHAETKAKLRAIADLGVKRSYNPSELQKPFAVASLMWTGQTDDPELKREAFRLQHQQMTGAVSSLYGDQPKTLPKFEGHDPPPVGSVDDDPGDLGTADVDTSGEDVDESPDDERY